MADGGKAHPSLHHDRAAARHLHEAAQRADEVVAHRERGEAHTAHEISKGVMGRLDEVHAHYAEAQRLHEQHARDAQDNARP